MDMEIKTTVQSKVHPLRAFHGVIMGLVCAISAELCLSRDSFSSEPIFSIANMALCFLVVYAIHRFALESLARYKPKLKDLITLTLSLVISLAIIWMGRIFAIGVSTYFAAEHGVDVVSADSLNFGIPFAAGALLLQSVLGLHYGLIYGVCLALMVGIYNPGHMLLVPYILTTSLIACLSLSRFRSRSAYLKAGANIALIAFPFALASIVLEGETITFTDIIVRLVSALVGGALCSFLAAGLTSIVEHIFGYITDMRLIEMATIDHPLLKDLSIQAPGTWNHSMVMGMMVEAAADEIGANAVLGRVGAYFHDIGKTTKPLYFVENQGGGENRHDKLSTSMSALIIRSHVKDGIELARKHKLPKAIIDMIPQHHGTSLIEYFYEKAKKEAVEAGEENPEIDRSLYSYPGPKPQTKEAGILMLADGIEAAARTLSDPTVDRIQGLVQKMMNKVFASGQLNECDLTLRDLHVIAKNFTRVLSSIYHQRVAYAEPAEKVKDPEAAAEKSGKKKSSKKKKSANKPAESKEKQSKEEQNGKAKLEGSNSSEPSESKGEESSESEEKDGAKETPKEDLKRLGL